ncbi:MAG TPA: hypothetical protein VM889_00895 [Candidatus Thermoplasmatota archaeon]|nr:hypothetical protein [Candidatus Thermoplasmatota archaeon]
MAEQRETQREPQEIPHAVQHIEIATKNPELLKAFLAEQFDWTFETTQGDYHMFRTPGGTGGGVVRTREEQPVGVTPYINVKDIEGVQDACRRAGARIVLPVTEVPDMGRFFWFEVEGSPPLACWESY